MRKLTNKTQEVISKYKGGLSAYTIAKNYNVNHKTIYKLLHRNNVNVRSNAESKNAYYLNSGRLSNNTVNEIDGWLLGDGSLTKTSTPQTNFVLTTVHLEYANHVKSVLEKDVMSSITLDVRTKYKNGVAYVVHTKRTKHIKELYNKWYSDNKIVPRSLSLCPTIIANWIMDDGSLDKNHKTLHLYACSFGMNDLNFLVNGLKNITNEHISIVNTKKYPYIYVGKKATKKLFEYIGNCPVRCFSYKWANNPKCVMEGESC